MIEAVESDLSSSRLPECLGPSLGEERLAPPGDFGRFSSSGFDHLSSLCEAQR